MGEIAEALKRSREERQSREGSGSRHPAPEPSGQGSSIPVPPGRAELLAALQQSQNEPSEPAPSERLPDLGTEGGRTETSEAAPKEVPDEPFHVLDESSLETLGRVELHRQLALQVSTQLELRSAQTLAVVSALRNEGKTTVACTLAIALASVTAHRSVALVDLDLRNPSVGRRMNLATGIGVEQFVLGSARLDEIRISLAEPQLDVYPSIEPQRSAHELLAKPQLKELIRQLEQRYQTIIIDTPPTLIVPDTSLILKTIPYCLAVARAEITRVRRFEEMLDILPTDAILGKVLNAANLPSKDAGYYEYSYGAEEEEEE